MRLALEAKVVRTAIVLATLAISAYFSASGVTSLAAGALFPPEPVTTASARGASTEQPPGSERPDLQALLKRNMFDPTTGPLWPPKAVTPVDPTEGGPIDEPLAEGEVPPPCDGTTRLVAAIYSERFPDWSFASMSSGSEEPLLYRVGGRVGDKEVSAIYPKAVFMKAATGRQCSLVMFADRSAVPAPTRIPMESPTTGEATPATPATGGAMMGGGAITESELDSNIKAISETKFSVSRGFVDKVLQNQAEIMRSARIVPHEENGQVVGVKLYGIRRNSLLGKLGLQNGDLMRTINGYAMSSPDTALEAYAKLRSANNLSVAVVRRGRPLSVEYDITGGPAQ